MDICLKNDKLSNNLSTITYFLLIVITPKFSYSHSGNTNSYGCHNDNIRGRYHCHNKKNVEIDEFEVLKNLSEETTFVGELFSIYLPIIFVI